MMQKSPKKLELIPSMQSHLDENIINEAAASFRELLKTDYHLLEQALAKKDWQELEFQTEKLLGAAVYFNVPALHLTLKALMHGAIAQIANQHVLNKVAQAISNITES